MINYVMEKQNLGEESAKELVQRKMQLALDQKKAFRGQHNRKKKKLT